ncbi:MAG: DNA topoisomerase IV subunit A, partial [Thermoproteota archaeon]|nr:DNA topoisomerase IV subunit A [Thermoproteota archaeon]
MAKKQIKKITKKQPKKEKADKSKMLIEILKNHGAQIYEDLENGQFPKFSIPNRSISNIIYDKKLRQYVLGTNTSLRSSRNSSQLRSFTQLLWLAFFANKLTHEKKSSTLRDVYYSSQAFAIDFEDQQESDNIIVDLE